MRLFVPLGRFFIFALLLTGSSFAFTAHADEATSTDPTQTEATSTDPAPAVGTSPLPNAEPEITINWPNGFLTTIVNHDKVLTATVTGGGFINQDTGNFYTCVTTVSSTSIACTFTQNSNYWDPFYFVAQSPEGNVVSKMVLINTIDKTPPDISAVHLESNNATSTSMARVGDTVTLTFSVFQGDIPDVTIEGVEPDYYSDPYNPKLFTKVYTATHVMTANDPVGPVTFSIGTTTDGAGNTSMGTTTTWDNSFVDFQPDAAAPIDTGPQSSNVMFLPGIMGSRLYSDPGRLWEPIDESNDTLALLWLGIGDARVNALGLDENGKSKHSNVYVYEGGIMNSSFGQNFYKSFSDEMDGLKSAGTITDWKPIAYDWRLSLPDLLNNGLQNGNRIYYGQASSTPYIEQTLRDLAHRSKTGRVTIIAHSNGGLVAKALMEKIGLEETARLIDKVILVAVPQSGTPTAVGSLLYGYDQGINVLGFPIVTAGAARGLAANSPTTYQLLPSSAYFGSVQDQNHSVGKFEGIAYAAERAAYGNFLGNWSELASFLGNGLGNREKPAKDDVNSAEIANHFLLSYAKSEHDELDAWQPPASTTVYQIAGWGVDSVAGVDFYTSLIPNLGQLTGSGPRKYRAIFTEDGDGTVPVPSALLMPESENVKRFWLNLSKIKEDKGQIYEHGNVFENQDLRNFLGEIIENQNPTSAYLVQSQPTPVTENKKLIFFLHSPLTLGITDASGNHTGLNTDGTVDENIPGSSYGQFGEVKYLIAPAGAQYQLALHGQSSGSFSLDLQEQSGGAIVASSTISGVPTTASTTASLTIAGSLASTSPLTVDEDGNGTADITIAPQINAAVVYTPTVAPTSAPVPVVEAAHRSSFRSGQSSASTIAATATPIITAIQIQKNQQPTPVPTKTARVQKTKAASSTKIAVASTTKTTNKTQTAAAYNAGGGNAFKWLKTALYNTWQASSRALQSSFKIFSH